MGIIKSLKPGTFMFNVATLMSGTALSQAVPFLASLVLCRLYSPADFGTLALFMSYVSVFSVVATGRYETAILLPKSSRDALDVVALSCSVAILFSALLGLAALLKNFLLPASLVKGLGSWLYFIPVSVLFLSLYQSLNSWSVRNKTFLLNSAAKITQTGSTALFNIGFGLLKTNGGLIIGAIIGHAAGFLVLWIRSAGELAKHLRGILPGSLRQKAVEYKDFPRFNMVHAFLSVMAANIPVFMMTEYFTRADVGLFSFSVRVVLVPISVFTSSVLQVFTQKTAEFIQKGESLRKSLQKIVRTFLLIGLIPFLAFILFAPDIFGFIFGQEWRTAGVYTQYMAPWLFMVFLVAPLSNIPVLKGYQKKAMIIELISFVLKAAGLFTGAQYQNIFLALILYSAAGFLTLVYNLVWIYQLSGTPGMKADNVK